MKTVLIAVVSLFGGWGISWATGLHSFAAGQFTDGTKVETIQIFPEATGTAVYQIKQPDGTVCYAISGTRNTASPAISCIK
ncbi:hypothetical protein ACES2I_04015 [Bdellovibrio bacteriovorus]|uniref:hypothetical protein n=1 Tax=Bdellovibrio bacteriovorus TaxID=959 RepID=UPI0035A706F0